MSSNGVVPLDSTETEIMGSQETHGKVEKKGLLVYSYSREEMETMRFLDLDEQKKKWVQVYCGLGPLVSHHYDSLLLHSHNNANNDVVNHTAAASGLVVEFDPRPPRRNPKTTLLGKDHIQVDDWNKSDPASQLSVSDGICDSILKGDCCDDDDDDDEDSDEEYSSIQRPAFLVTGEPDFDSGPPQDGLEYLRRVRWETARIPKVVVAKVGKSKKQSPYMPQIPDIMDCPQHLLPCKEWENSFLADFQELRLAISRLDQPGDGEKGPIQFSVAQEGLYLMFDNITSQSCDNMRPADDSDLSDSSCILETSNAKSDSQSSRNTNGLPTLSAILKMGAAARSSMLRRRISSIENMSTLSRDNCLWLFALCAAVDCPLDADTTASIRSLLRKCASLRAAKTEQDEEVAVLNILATIAGRYFGQLEKKG